MNEDEICRCDEFREVLFDLGEAARNNRTLEARIRTLESENTTLRDNIGLAVGVLESVACDCLPRPGAQSTPSSGHDPLCAKRKAQRAIARMGLTQK